MDEAAAHAARVVGILLALSLLIPAAVIVLVSPRTRGPVLGLTRYVAWIVAGAALLGLLGWFTSVRRDEAAVPPPQLPPAEAIVSAAADSSNVPGGFAASGQSVTSTRPNWIDRPAALEDSTYRVAVKSGLYVTPAECQRGLDAAIGAAMQQYAAAWLGADQATALANLDPAAFRPRLVHAPLYAETVDSSVGVMQQLHALLEFDDSVRSDLGRLWHRALVSQRLRYTGAGFALLLAAIGTLCAYLKADIATAGAHTRRLRWAAGLAILLVAAGAWRVCLL